MKRPVFPARDDLRPSARMLAFSLAIAACLSVQAVSAAAPTAKGKSKRPQAARYIATCSWDNPGLRPFMGDVVAAVDRYRDIPLAVRTRLKERMAVRQYDDFVDIERNAIVGQRQYEPGIREMHFGDNRVCGTITRTKWTPAMRERGLVYCEGDHCILVPTVCRNVSRIARRPLAETPGGGVPAGAVPEGGGHALYGWLTVQARGLDEPGWVGRSGPGVGPYTPFLPPYSGGPSWPIGPESASPVPEAPTWLMLAVGAAVVTGVARTRRRRPDR